MSISLIKIVETKTPALKKEIPAARKAMRYEMSSLYSKIANSYRRRAADSWSRPH